MTPLVIGIDPGFAKVGYSIVRLDRDKLVPITMGILRTKKSDKKLKVLASDDNFRRARELAEALIELATEASAQGEVVAICAEAKSFPRNASAAAKVAMFWGILALFCVEKGLPLIQARPQEIKKKMCGETSASKEEVQAACRETFGDEISLLVEEIGKSDLEHPYDALAAVVACSDSETLRLARRMAVL